MKWIRPQSLQAYPDYAELDISIPSAMVTRRLRSSSGILVDDEGVRMLRADYHSLNGRYTAAVACVFGHQVEPTTC
jgi:hypothetical protein